MNGNIRIETQIRSLTTLLDELRQGNLQVPPFQREFVWERDAIKDLFDSIRNNYPIGSILLWKPKTKQPWESLKRVGSYYLPKTNEQKTFLLDGYQRLSSLFGCLTNPTKSELERNEYEYTTFFNLYFDLEDESFIYLRSNNKPLPYQVPVYILMSTSDFRQYSRKYIEPFCKFDKLDIYLDRADIFSRSLIDYKLAVIEISEADLSDAVSIFSRINSKGTDITFDWMVNALSYNEDFQFAYEIDTIKEKLLAYNFGSISRNTIFRCYQSAFDDKLYIDQTNIEALATRPDFCSVVKTVSPCIIKAVEFLYNEMNVIEYRLLPYNIQLVFIMMFFKLLPTPNEKQLNDLRQWFWITTYSNYFTIYSLANQRKAFAQFLLYLCGKTSEMVYYDDKSIPFKTMPFPSTIILSGVRSKALILFELKYCREYTNDFLAKTGLFLHKINAQERNLPENMIPFCSIKEKESIICNDKLWEMENEKEVVTKYFLPSKSIDVKLFLERRKEKLIQAEKAFVETLGIDYTLAVNEATKIINL